MLCDYHNEWSKNSKHVVLYLNQWNPLARENFIKLISPRDERKSCQFHLLSRNSAGTVLFHYYTFFKSVNWNKRPDAQSQQQDSLQGMGKGLRIWHASILPWVKFPSSPGSLLFFRAFPHPLILSLPVGIWIREQGSRNMVKNSWPWQYGWVCVEHREGTRCKRKQNCQCLTFLPHSLALPFCITLEKIHINMLQLLVTEYAHE